MRVIDKNNWVAVGVLFLILAWLLKGLLFKDTDAEIKSKTELVKAGQSSSNITTQKRGVIAQKELAVIKEKKAIEEGELQSSDLAAQQIQ